jgi:tripartite-type tricarboxylate transporter receptor subunit TctC
VVEPRPGAAGTIASARAAKATADGYTLILLTSGHAVTASTYASLPFDPVDDYAMISMATTFPMLISVRADSPFGSLADLIAAAKAKPGTISFSSVGVGSTQHLTGELFSSLTGIKLLHVPYKGGTAPVSDLLGGQIDVMVDTITVTQPQVAAGRIRALGVSSAAPWPTLPDVPPIARTVPGFEVRAWTGLAGPKGLPQPIVERLNQEMRHTLAATAVKERIEQMGSRLTPTSPAEMHDFVAAEVRKWHKVAADAHVEPK